MPGSSRKPPKASGLSLAEKQARLLEENERWARKVEPLERKVRELERKTNGQDLQIQDIERRHARETGRLQAEQVQKEEAWSSREQELLAHKCRLTSELETATGIIQQLQKTAQELEGVHKELLFQNQGARAVSFFFILLGRQFGETTHELARVSQERDEFKTRWQRLDKRLKKDHPAQMAPKPQEPPIPVESEPSESSAPTKRKFGIFRNR